jgi:hypothetical protein
MSAVTYFGGEVVPGVGGVEDGLHGEHIQLPGLQQWGAPALLQHVQAARQEHLTGYLHTSHSLKVHSTPTPPPHFKRNNLDHFKVAVLFNEK